MASLNDEIFHFSVKATGKWRNLSEQWIASLRDLLGEKYDVAVLSQTDEGRQQAASAFKLMKMGGLLDQIPDDSVVLFMGAGRGSTQLTLMFMDSSICDIKMGTGYSKDGPPPVEELRQLFKQIEDCSGLGLVVAFDSFFHICKGSCPVVPDGSELPSSVTTKCKDFADALEILPASWAEMPMIVVRNFKLRGSDELRKIGHLTTFEEGQGVGDLGSGRFAVVDPLNGTARYSTDLPDGWEKDVASLPVIADLIRGGEPSFC